MWNVQNIYTDEWLHLLTDGAFFHVGAALVKYEYNELVNSGTKAQPEVLQHKIEALRVVRRRLKESDGVLDNVTLIAIMFLPFVEVGNKLRIQSIECSNTKIVQDLTSSLRSSQIHWTAVSKMFATRVQNRRIEDGLNAPYFRRVLDQ